MKECTEGGVDLNRNFPFEWDSLHTGAGGRDNDRRGRKSGRGGRGACSPGSTGTAPFSEPETQALRNLLTSAGSAEPPVVAALSFHALTNDRFGRGLLIHPYTFAESNATGLPPAERRRLDALAQRLDPEDQFPWLLIRPKVGSGAGRSSRRSLR